jgi:hypothetical protein
MQTFQASVRVRVDGRLATKCYLQTNPKIGPGPNATLAIFVIAVVLNAKIIEVELHGFMQPS